VMKENGMHDGTIEQTQRLVAERVYTADGAAAVDEKGRIRVADWAMREDVQEELARLWAQTTTENLEEVSDIKGYRDEFFHLFGFNFPEVTYEADSNEVVNVPSIEG